ncbi:MAG: hypothetical protein M3279_07230 [Actinomycetota bacterium]|nr:hypothetical protein [Actinomycetota bacterium]
MRMRIGSSRLKARRRSAPAAALVSVLLLTGAVFPPATSLARTAPAKLAGRTRITGNATSVTWVTIPKPVAFGTDDIRIQGAGRIAGFVLTETPVDDLEREFVMAARTSLCETPGCTSNDVYEFVAGPPPGTADIMLEPGRYLLYLLADGAPVSVTLRLQGVRGATEVRPSTPVDAGVSVPDAETRTTLAGDRAYWFGDSASIAADAGLFVGVLGLEAKQWVEGVHGSCLQREVHSPPQVAFSPLCPAGGGMRSVEGYPLSPIDRKLYVPSIWNVEPGGDWGLGLHYVAAADVQKVSAMTFHLAYQLPPD